MTNKIANLITTRVTRPLITGQRSDAVEAAIDGIVHAVFGEELLPPCNPASMWQGPARARLQGCTDAIHRSTNHDLTSG